MCYIFQCKNLRTSHIKLITFECMRKIFTKLNVLGSVRYVLEISYRGRYRSSDWRIRCAQEFAFLNKYSYVMIKLRIKWTEHVARIRKTFI